MSGWATSFCGRPWFEEEGMAGIIILQVNCRETEELCLVHVDRFSQEWGAGFHMHENIHVKKKSITKYLERNWYFLLKTIKI